MLYDEEKDYLMRMIRETSEMLFSVLLGKPYAHVEPEAENLYEICGKTLREYKDMVDRGDVNEAENRLLCDMDGADRNEAAAAVLFYRHIAEKGEEFLKQNGYSLEEALDGLNGLAEKTGLKEMCELIRD